VTDLVVGAIGVPLVDQAIKLLVLDRLSDRSLSLGPIGHLRAMHTRIWIARVRSTLSLPFVWTLWILAAIGIITLHACGQASGWSTGLLLGGSFSHLIETSIRGWICDYVCLRFWPAFNLADVALTIGGAGLAIELVMTMHRVLR